MVQNVSGSERKFVSTLSQRALEGWGREVGAAVSAGELGPPLVVALRGELGAGKSVLARAMARGAGVDGPMPSPTYNLVFSYEGAGVRVHHLDLYRLDYPDDVWELGWEELGAGDQVVMIEWPDRAEALLPPDRWEVTLSFVDDDDDDDDGDAGDDGDDGDAAASRRRVDVRRVGASPAVTPLPPSGS